MNLLRKVEAKLREFGSFGEFLILFIIIFAIEFVWQIVRLMATGRMPFDWLFE
ncbi:MAG: hypothetical protein K9J17_02465 [Flavobacteriales bacterium]|nr:hypothetical protein [Flavobacteriales bacterium]